MERIEGLIIVIGCVVQAVVVTWIIARSLPPDWSFFDKRDADGNKIIKK